MIISRSLIKIFRSKQSYLVKKVRVMQNSYTTINSSSSTCSLTSWKNTELMNGDNENHYTANLSNGFMQVFMNPVKVKPHLADSTSEKRDEEKQVSVPSANSDHEAESAATASAAAAAAASSELIPETVLQYERQLRKNKAAKKASTPITASHLHVIHNDANIIVANKPSGVLTVPGVNANPNLLSLIYETYRHEIEKEMIMQHMIIHRLDMDTSGIVIFAKDKKSMSELQKSFRERNVDKQYEAVVCGHIPLDTDAGSIDLPLQRDHRFPPFMRVATPESERQAQIVVKDLNHAGWKKIVKKKAKPSKTLFHVLRREYVHFDNHQLPVTRLQLTPITGRTHQLRVHCAAIGYPILGDPAYGIMGEASPNGGFDEESMNMLMPIRASLQLQLDLDQYVKRVDKNMCLHARKLSLRHPIDENDVIFEFAPDF